LGHDPTDRVDDAADPTVRSPDEISAMFDGPHLRESEVLPRFGRVEKPCVIGQVDQELGTRMPHGIICELGQDILVTDEDGNGVPFAPDVDDQRVERCARREVSAVGRPPVQYGKRVSER
jgi:hypothetical protein